MSSVIFARFGRYYYCNSYQTNAVTSSEPADAVTSSEPAAALTSSEPAAAVTSSDAAGVRSTGQLSINLLVLLCIPSMSVI